MREHGIKVEASANGGAIRIGIHGRRGAGEPNPESPAFQQAQAACQKLLPGGGPKGQPTRSPGLGTSKGGAGSSSGLALSGG
jgi:hypothetical protein